MHTSQPLLHFSPFQEHSTGRKSKHCIFIRLKIMRIVFIFPLHLPFPFKNLDLCSLHGLALVRQIRDKFVIFFQISKCFTNSVVGPDVNCLDQPQHPKTGQQSGNLEPQLISRPHQNIFKRLRPPPVTGSIAGFPLLPTVDIVKF